MKPVGRAIAVAELLRQGWTAGEVSAGIKAADAGGSPLEAIQAMEAARRSRSATSSPSKSELLEPNTKGEGG